MKVRSLFKPISVSLMGVAFAFSAQADQLRLGETWRLNPQGSELRFQSIKDETKVESSTFEYVQGVINEDGNVEITVALDSINTGIDLRNVRMRFLYFETFRHPEARIEAKLEPETVSQILTSQRVQMNLPVELELYGVRKRIEGDVIVTRLPDGTVSVASQRPISLSVADFGMMEGLRKLERVAGVDIVPSATVTFDFIFAASDELPAIAEYRPAIITDKQKREFTRAAATQTSRTTAPQSFALETDGNFTKEACIGRFEILSQTGNIFFSPNSASITNDSVALLNEVVDIVSRCPDQNLKVAGHTDNIGSSTYNLLLSQQRAESVVKYLVDNGIDKRRLSPAGYGETRPIAANTTSEGRKLNRRIEFLAIQPQS